MNRIINLLSDMRKDYYKLRTMRIVQLEISQCKQITNQID